MLLVADGDQLMAVATDGHRLAFSSMKIEGSFARQEVIIPRKTILELQRLLEDIDDTLKIAHRANAGEVHALARSNSCRSWWRASSPTSSA